MKPFGILLISMGDLSKSMQTLAEMLLGGIDNLSAVALHKDDHWDDALVKVRKSISIFDQDKGVLILADVVGSTPCNVAQELRSNFHVEVIGGVNVPMMIKAIQISNEMQLENAATYLEKYGKDHVIRLHSRHVGEAHGR